MILIQSGATVNTTFGMRMEVEAVTEVLRCGFLRIVNNHSSQVTSLLSMSSAHWQRCCKDSPTKFILCSLVIYLGILYEQTFWNFKQSCTMLQVELCIASTLLKLLHCLLLIAHQLKLPPLSVAKILMLYQNVLWFHENIVIPSNELIYTTNNFQCKQEAFPYKYPLLKTLLPKNDAQQHAVLSMYTYVAWQQFLMWHWSSAG